MARPPRGRPGFPGRSSASVDPLGIVLRVALGYAAFLFLSYLFSSAAWQCPKALECERGTPGYFWDPPKSTSSHKGGRSGHRGGGHLMERDVGLGLLAQDSCSKLCQDVPDCAYWMYTQGKQAGTCKLWAVDQSPCAPMRSSFLFPFPTVHFTSRGAAARASIVGGPCRVEGEDIEEPHESAKGQEEGTPRSLVEDGMVDISKLKTTECPHLECAVTTRGFLFDHEDKGHLKTIRFKIRKRRAYNCFMHCRETPGCSLWMVDESAEDGDCKMWSKDQSPCEPTDPYDSMTAHYVEHIPGRHFLIGGNCHTLALHPPRPPPA